MPKPQILLERQAALAEIELAINQPHELITVLDQVVNIATQSLSASIGAGIALLDSHSDTFLIGSTNMQSQEGTKTFRLFRQQSKSTQWIVENKKPLLIPDVDKDPFGPNFYISALGIKAYAGVPLLVDEEVLGVLYVMDNSIRHYAQDDIQFLTALANRAALAIAKVRLYQSLKDAKEAAENSARAKAEFLANVSHELRTPLTAIISLSELLLETKLDRIQSDFVDTVRGSALRLLDLINDILDLSRLEAAKISIKSHQFDLFQVIDSSMEMVAVKAAEKNLELAYRVAEDVPAVLVGDAMRVSQVLTNLLSNAVKFTDTGNIFVEVVCAPAGDHLGQAEPAKLGENEIELLFSVHDTGIGIPPPMTALLFKAFSQIEGLPNQKSNGSGLGLTICKQLVNLMGGEIWVKSSGLIGEGSTFFFTLRIGTVPELCLPYLQKTNAICQDKQALVICQKIVNRDIIEHHLRFWGMQVYQIDNCLEAIRWLKNKPSIDLAILDVGFSQEMDFAALLEIMDRMRQYHQVPLILLTPAGEKKNSDLASTFTGVLHRPVSPANFYDLLAKVLSQPKPSALLKIQDNKQSISQGLPLEILLAEDDPVIQKVLRLTLERLGYRPEVVDNGLKVLETLEDRQFDVILLDIQMPELDGLATTRCIRETIPVNQQPFIIILSADTRQDTQTALFEAGADRFINKPFSGEVLSHVLDQAIAHRKSTPSWSTAPRKAQAKPIDEAILGDLMQSIGMDDSGAQAEIFTLFFNNTPELIKKIKSSAAESEWEKLQSELHALKGSCELFGAARLSEMCKNLEKETGHGEFAGLTNKVSEIEEEFGLVVESLKATQLKIGLSAARI